MHKTNIEYGDVHWPVWTGCDQPASVCLTQDKCWARRLHNRFHKKWDRWEGLYKPNFAPRFNEHLLNEPLHLRKPAHILVGFTGDGFGPGTFGLDVERVQEVVRESPQHTYYFLTKSPDKYRLYNPWPENAWPGATLTGGEPVERQAEIIFDLRAVEGNRWLSWEPILGPIHKDICMQGIDWLVMGAQSGPGAMIPLREWIDNFWVLKRPQVSEIWIKNNLLKVFPDLPRIQERP